jgi:hypothetical protein
MSEVKNIEIALHYMKNMMNFIIVFVQFRNSSSSQYAFTKLWLSVLLVEEISVPGEIYQSNGKYLTNFNYVKLYQIYLPTCRNKISKINGSVVSLITRPLPPKVIF